MATWMRTRLGGWLLAVCLTCPGLAAADEFAERLAAVEKQVNVDAPAAVAAAREILAGAQAAGDAQATAEARRVLGVGLNVSGDNQEALAVLAEARKGFAALGLRLREGMVRRSEGVAWYDLDRNDQALENYLAALDIFQALGERIEMAKTRANIANVMLANDRLEQAIIYQREALVEFEQARVSNGIAGTALNLGVALVRLSDRNCTAAAQRAQLLDEASGNFRKAGEIFRALGIDRGVLKAEVGAADVGLRLGDADGAARGLARAHALAVAAGDGQEETKTLLKLMQLEQGRGRDAEALTHARAGIEASLRQNDLSTEESFHLAASTLAERQGDFVAALRHARRAEELSDQRTRRDVELRIAELTRNFENQQRDREILSLRQAKELDRVQLARQRVQRNAALVIGVLAVGVLALMWSRMRLRERTRHDLEQAVATDPLTGLLNRRGLRALIGQRRSGDPDCAVVICDIDNFKQINDVHGHDVGDIVLAETAHRLRAELRPDDCAARWGGEEFLLCLRDTTLSAAATAAERLRQAVAVPPYAGVPAGLVVSISLGVAAGSHGQGFDAVVRAADQALLQAKREGKNRVVVAPPKVRTLAPATAAPVASATVRSAIGA
jgi:diguanylate cyclase (GGDEF)-like protein